MPTSSTLVSYDAVQPTKYRTSAGSLLMSLGASLMRFFFLATLPQRARELRGNGVALFQVATGQHDIAENLRHLGAFVRHHAAHAAGADDQDSVHGWYP